MKNISTGTGLCVIGLGRSVRVLRHLPVMNTRAQRPMRRIPTSRFPYAQGRNAAEVSWRRLA